MSTILVMGDLTRVNFNIEPEYHQAFKLAAKRRGGGLANLFKELAEKHLATFLEVARAQLAAEQRLSDKHDGGSKRKSS